MLRRYPCGSFDQLSRVLVSREVEHEDPIGNDVLIRRRLGDAFEPFKPRKMRRSGERKPRSEELEADRRESERKKVRGMKKGTVRKKLL
jgi:hypothetical protein